MGGTMNRWQLGSRSGEEEPPPREAYYEAWKYYGNRGRIMEAERIAETLRRLAWTPRYRPRLGDELRNTRLR